MHEVVLRAAANRASKPGASSSPGAHRRLVSLSDTTTTHYRYSRVHGTEQAGTGTDVVSLSEKIGMVDAAVAPREVAALLVPDEIEDATVVRIVVGALEAVVDLGEVRLVSGPRLTTDAD